MDKEASTSGVRVYFTIPFVTPSLGGIMIFLFPDSKSKANADKSISLQNFGIPLLVPYTKDFGRITQF